MSSTHVLEMKVRKSQTCCRYNWSMYGDCEEEHCIAYDGASWLLLRSRFKSLI